MRSAVAFGVHGILVPKHRSAQVNETVARASAGATEHATIVHVTNLQRSIKALANEGLITVGLDSTGTHALSEIPKNRKGHVLVVGSEGKGLRRMVRERCDVLAHIPMQGPIASLNASVAAGIALYALRHRSF